MCFQGPERTLDPLVPMVERCLTGMLEIELRSLEAWYAHSTTELPLSLSKVSFSIFPILDVGLLPSSRHECDEFTRSQSISSQLTMEP